MITQCNYGENPGETYVQRALPSGSYERAAQHSGLAAKHFIDIGAVATGDEDYRGNIGVAMCSLGEEKTEVKKGGPLPCTDTMRRKAICKPGGVA